MTQHTAFPLNKQPGFVSRKLRRECLPPVPALSLAIAIKSETRNPVVYRVSTANPITGRRSGLLKGANALAETGYSQS